MEALQAHDSAWRELSEGQAKPRCPTLSIKPVPSPSRCQVPPVVVLPGNDVLLGAVSRRQGHLGTHLGDTTSGLLSEQGQGTVLTCIRLCRCVSRTSSQAFFVPGAFTYSKSAAGAAYSLLWVKYEVITHVLRWILFILILLICNMSSYSLSCTNHIHLGIIYSLLNDTSIAFNNII